MIETDPEFDRTQPLAPELSIQSRLFPPHEIVSGQGASPAPHPRVYFDTGTARWASWLVLTQTISPHDGLVSALEEDSAFESKA